MGNKTSVQQTSISYSEDCLPLLNKNQSIISNEWHDSIDMFYYINLQNRQDRNVHMKTLLLNKLSIPKSKITRIEAIKEFPGFKGCTKSHLKVIQHAKIMGFKEIVVMEDDFTVYVDSFVFHKRISAALSHLKGNFDLLFLAMTPIRVKRVRTETKIGLKRVKKALGMSAFILRNDYFDVLIDIYEKAQRRNTPHDLITQIYQPRDRWYGFFPPIGNQMPGMSNIENRVVDYKHLDIDGKMLDV